MKKVLCTFGNKLISKGFPRFRQEAEALEVFDEICTYTEDDLSKEFRKKWGKYMYPYSKGYGYWAWKPFLIKETLNKMDDGDVLLYADLGCFFNAKGKARLSEYYAIVENSASGMLGFRSHEVNYNGMDECLRYEYEWTKGDILDYFGVRNDPYYTQTTQFEATVIFIKKSDISMAFVNEWTKVVDVDFDLITDKPSRTPNLKGFTENRHDQSIFSILAKKYKIEAVSTNELFPCDPNYDWSLLNDYPILARRAIYYKSTRHYNHRFKLRKWYGILWKLKYIFR